MQLPYSKIEPFVFYIYGDDSGKFKNPKDDFTSLCGYIAHASEWERFGMEWNNCRLRWQVPPIHMREIMYGKGVWEQVKTAWGADWETKRNDMLLEFAGIVRNASVMCVGAVVDAAHYRSLPDSEFKRAMPDAVHLAFHQLVMRGIAKTEIVDIRSPIGVVVDDDRDSYNFCYEVLDSLKARFPKVKERVTSISFARDDFVPGLQAADMISYEARKYMVRKVKNQKTEEDVLGLYSLLTFLAIHQPKHYTPDVLNELNSRPLSQDGLGAQ